MNLRILLSLCIASMTGCMTVPPDLQGRYPRVTQDQAITPAALGETVRWGGQVLGPRDVGTDACVEVISYVLTSNDARPDSRVRRDRPRPFLACGAKDSGHDLTRDGTLVTFTGVIDAPLVFDVPKQQCLGSSSGMVAQGFDHPNGVYDGAKYVIAGDRCTVSLARLDVSTSHVWADMVYPTPLPRAISP